MNKKLTRLLSLALAALMVFSLCSCNSNTTEEETTTVPYADAEVKEGDVAKADLVAKFNKLMADTKNAKGYEEMKYWLDQSAGGVECENATVSSFFKLFSDKSTSNGYDISTTGKDENGKSYTAVECFPVMDSTEAAALNLSDVRSAIITDNEADTSYTIVLTINPETNPDEGTSIYGKLYNISEDEVILEEFAKFDEFFTVGEYNATYGVGTIKMIVDKETDHVTKLELSRNVVVETSVTGQGTLAEEIGADVPVKFNYDSTANYEILWPAPAAE